MRIYESIRKYETMLYNIRIWAKRGNATTTVRVEKEVEFLHREPSEDVLLEKLGCIPGVNAVEVIDKRDGEGIVLYLEWP